MYLGMYQGKVCPKLLLGERLVKINVLIILQNLTESPLSKSEFSKILSWGNIPQTPFHIIDKLFILGCKTVKQFVLLYPKHNSKVNF